MQEAWGRGYYSAPKVPDRNRKSLVTIGGPKQHNSATWGAQNHMVLQLEEAVTAKLRQGFEHGSRNVSASSHEFLFQGTQILPS